VVLVLPAKSGARDLLGMRMGMVAVPEFMACAWSNVFSVVAEVVGGGLEVRESHFSFLRPDGKTRKSRPVRPFSSAGERGAGG